MQIARTAGMERVQVRGLVPARVRADMAGTMEVLALALRQAAIAGAEVPAEVRRARAVVAAMAVATLAEVAAAVRILEATSSMVPAGAPLGAWTERREVVCVTR